MRRGDCGSARARPRPDACLARLVRLPAGRTLLAGGILAALAAGLLASCAGKPPEILRVLWRVTLVDDRELNTRYTSVSLFVRPNDPDGIDDLAELYLISDPEELFWKLEAESWQKSATGEPWIGSNALGLPDGSPLPAGEYRLLLRDLGGDSTEQTVNLPAVSREELERLVPRVEVRAGQIRAQGRASTLALWLYDSGGAFLAIWPMPGGRQAVSELLAASPQLAKGFRFKVYATSAREGVGALSGPYFWEP